VGASIVLAPNTTLTVSTTVQGTLTGLSRFTVAAGTTVNVAAGAIIGTSSAFVAVAQLVVEGSIIFSDAPIALSAAAITLAGSGYLKLGNETKLTIDGALSLQGSSRIAATRTLNVNAGQMLMAAGTSISTLASASGIGGSGAGGGAPHAGMPGGCTVIRATQWSGSGCGVATYGNFSWPNATGSAGVQGLGTAIPAGGKGGGFISIVVASTATLSGVIDASGGAGSNTSDAVVTSCGGGGGSGGSIAIRVGTLLPSAGTLRVNGGAGGGALATQKQSGGGGGGRVALQCDTDASGGQQPTLQAYGGVGSPVQVQAGAGTAFVSCGTTTFRALRVVNAPAAKNITNTIVQSPSLSEFAFGSIYAGPLSVPLFVGPPSLPLFITVRGLRSVTERWEVAPGSALALLATSTVTATDFLLGYLEEASTLFTSPTTVQVSVRNSRLLTVDTLNYSLTNATLYVPPRSVLIAGPFATLLACNLTVTGRMNSTRQLTLAAATNATLAYDVCDGAVMRFDAVSVWASTLSVANCALSAVNFTCNAGSRIVYAPPTMRIEVWFRLEAGCEFVVAGGNGTLNVSAAFVYVSPSAVVRGTIRWLPVEGSPALFTSLRPNFGPIITMEMLVRNNTGRAWDASDVVEAGVAGVTGYGESGAVISGTQTPCAESEALYAPATSKIVVVCTVPDGVRALVRYAVTAYITLYDGTTVVAPVPYVFPRSHYVLITWDAPGNFTVLPSGDLDSTRISTTPVINATLQEVTGEGLAGLVAVCSLMVDTSVSDVNTAVLSTVVLGDASGIGADVLPSNSSFATVAFPNIGISGPFDAVIPVFITCTVSGAGAQATFRSSSRHVTILRPSVVFESVPTQVAAYCTPAEVAARGCSAALGMTPIPKVVMTLPVVVPPAVLSATVCTVTTATPDVTLAGGTTSTVLETRTAPFPTLTVVMAPGSVAVLSASCTWPSRQAVTAPPVSVAAANLSFTSLLPPATQVPLFAPLPAVTLSVATAGSLAPGDVMCSAALSVSRAPDGSKTAVALQGAEAFALDGWSQLATTTPLPFQVPAAPVVSAGGESSRTWAPLWLQHTATCAYRGWPLGVVTSTVTTLPVAIEWESPFPRIVAASTRLDALPVGVVALRAVAVADNGTRTAVPLPQTAVGNFSCYISTMSVVAAGRILSASATYARSTSDSDTAASRGAVANFSIMALVAPPGATVVLRAACALPGSDQTAAVDATVATYGVVVAWADRMDASWVVAANGTAAAFNATADAVAPLVFLNGASRTVGVQVLLTDGGDGTAAWPAAGQLPALTCSVDLMDATARLLRLRTLTLAGAQLRTDLGAGGNGTFEASVTVRNGDSTAAYMQVACTYGDSTVTSTLRPLRVITNRLVLNSTLPAVFVPSPFGRHRPFTSSLQLVLMDDAGAVLVDDSSAACTISAQTSGGVAVTITGPYSGGQVAARGVVDFQDVGAQALLDVYVTMTVTCSRDDGSPAVATSFGAMSLGLAVSWDAAATAVTAVPYNTRTPLSATMWMWQNESRALAPYDPSLFGAAECDLRLAADDAAALWFLGGGINATRARLAAAGDVLHFDLYARRPDPPYGAIGVTLSCTAANQSLVTPALTIVVLEGAVSWATLPPALTDPASTSYALPLLPAPLLTAAYNNGLRVPSSELLCTLAVAASGSAAVESSSVRLVGKAADAVYQQANDSAPVVLYPVAISAAWGTTVQLTASCSRRAGDPLQPVTALVSIRNASLAWLTPPPGEVQSQAPFSFTAAALDVDSGAPRWWDNNTVCTATPMPAATTKNDGAGSTLGVAAFTGVSIAGRVGGMYTLTVACRLGDTAYPDVLTTPIRVAGCARGLAPLADGITCVQCPSGQFSDGGSGNCTRCPSEGVSCVDGVLVAQPNIYYAPLVARWLAGNEDSAAGSTGTGNTSDGLVAAVIDGTTEFHPCYNSEACVVDVVRRLYGCATGYTGPLCGVCAAGWAKQGERCVPCLSHGRNYIVLAAVGAIILLVLIWLSLFKNFGSPGTSDTIYRIIVTWLSALTSFSLYVARGTESFNVGTSYLQSVVVPASAAGIEMSPVTCEIAPTFYERYTATILLPFIVAVACIAINLVYLPLGVVTGRLASMRIGLTAFIASRKPVAILLIVCFLAFPNLTRTAFLMYTCRWETIGGTHYLDNDLSVSCDTAIHATGKVAAAVVIALFCLGLPLGFSWWLVRHEADVKAADINSPFFKTFGFLFKGLRTDNWRYYCWEAVVMIRRAVLILIAVLANDAYYQVGCAIVVLTMAFGLHLHTRPYVDAQLNRLEALALLDLIFTLCLNLLYQRSIALAEGDISRATVARWSVMGHTWGVTEVVCTVLLFIINGATFIALVRAFFRRRVTELRARARAILARIRGTGTGVASSKLSDDGGDCAGVMVSNPLAPTKFKPAAATAPGLLATARRSHSVVAATLPAGPLVAAAPAPAATKRRLSIAMDGLRSPRGAQRTPFGPVTSVHGGGSSGGSVAGASAGLPSSASSPHQLHDGASFAVVSPLSQRPAAAAPPPPRDARRPVIAVPAVRPTPPAAPAASIRRVISIPAPGPVPVVAGAAATGSGGSATMSSAAVISTNSTSSAAVTAPPATNVAAKDVDGVRTFAPVATARATASRTGTGMPAAGIRRAGMPSSTASAAV